MFRGTILKRSRLFRRCLNNRYDSGCCKAVILTFGQQTALPDTKYFPRRCGIETHPDTALFSGFAGKKVMRPFGWVQYIRLPRARPRANRRQAVLSLLNGIPSSGCNRWLSCSRKPAWRLSVFPNGLHRHLCGSSPIGRVPLAWRPRPYANI